MPSNKLLAIYGLFDEWAKDFTFACQKRCSTCCTQSVSMTMLEGELIYNYIKSEKPELLATLEKLPAGSFTPPTTNQFAASCLSEKIVKEEEVNWDMTPCVFLHNDCCTIYPVRSFMCRSLGSQVACAETGEAVMDPVFLTLNTLILQCIEHLDQGRPWGNMYSILKLLSAEKKKRCQQQEFRISQPIPGFLVPPEEQDQIKEQLQTLVNIVTDRVSPS